MQTMRALLTECEVLYDAGKSHEVVAKMDDFVAEGGEPSEDLLVRLRVTILRARALNRLERAREALDLLDEVVGRNDVPDGDLAVALELRARLVDRVRNAPDQSIWDAKRAAMLAADPLVKAAALAQAAWAYARKGTISLAKKVLAEAYAAAPDDGLPPYFDGYVHIRLDERVKARDLFEIAVGRGGRGGDLGRVGLAYVAELLGEFESAAAHLDAVETKLPDDLRLRRRRAEIFTLLGREDQEARLLREILAISPKGDFARHDRLRLAEIAYRAGRIDEAVATCDSLCGESTEDPQGRAADRMRGKLRAAQALPEWPRRHRLANFPTVAQKRSHCGPCTIELVLRHYGLQTDQDAIAKVIKLETGTPTYAMLEYFRDQGFVTRRFEGTVDKLRSLIDAGIPVIIEEEYSMSTHVAVVVGYDEALDLLIVQDPMTHRVRESWREGMGKLQGLFNHGAIVGVPQARTDLVDVLDRLGIVDAEYIVLTEQAWKFQRENKLAEADKAIDASMALRDDFEMAWIFRLNRAFDDLYGRGGDDASDKVRELTGKCRDRFADDEWPWQYVARFHFFEGRYADALEAYQKAHERDLADTNNLNFLGECYHRMGRAEKAFETWQKALAMDPGHLRVNENLAGHYVDLDRRMEAEHFVEVAVAMNYTNAFNHENQGILRARMGDLQGAIDSFDQALRQDARRVRALSEKGKALQKLGRREEAIRFFTDATKVAPRDPWPRVDLADAYLRSGDPEAARKAIEPAYAVYPDNHATNAVLGAALFRLGRAAEAEPMLRKAIQLWPRYSWARTELAWGLLKAGRAKEALSVWEEAERQEPANMGFALDSTHALEALGRAEEAADKCAKLVETTGSRDLGVLRRAAELAIKAGRLQESKAIFDRALERTPGDLSILKEGVLFLMDHDKHAEAEPWARQAVELAPTDNVLRASLGAACFRVGKDEEGERLLSEALAQDKGYEWARRELAGMLVERQRAKEALVLLEPAKQITPYVHFVRMRSHEQLSQYAQAAAEAGKAQELLGGRNAWYLGKMVELHSMAAEHGASAQAAERLMALDPKDGWARWMRAFALRHLGRTVEAEDALVAAERLGHDRGAVLGERFEVAKVRTDWARALVNADARCPDGRSRQDGATRADRLRGVAAAPRPPRRGARALRAPGARRRRPVGGRARRLRGRGLRRGAGLRVPVARDRHHDGRRAVLRRPDPRAGAGLRRGRALVPAPAGEVPGRALRPGEPGAPVHARRTIRRRGSARRQGRRRRTVVRECLGRARHPALLAGSPGRCAGRSRAGVRDGARSRERRPRARDPRLPRGGRLACARAAHLARRGRRAPLPGRANACRSDPDGHAPGARAVGGPACPGGRGRWIARALKGGVVSNASASIGSVALWLLALLGASCSCGDDDDVADGDADADVDAGGDGGGDGDADADGDWVDPPTRTLDLEAVDDVLLNPERGFYRTTSLVDAPDLAWVREAGASLVHSYVRLDDYRDRDLDDELLDAVRAGLDQVRAAGLKLILRFSYNFGPYPDSEPDAPKDRILGHIAQLAPILADEADVIAVVQAGFIGAWGEWHTSTNGLLDDPQDKYDILEALLGVLPDSRTVQLRYPPYKRDHYGEALDETTAWNGSLAARIGHHNDCFLASDDDWGTYPVGEEEAYKEYLAQDALYVPMGGETCNPNPPRSECESALAEMQRLHWTAVNDEYHPEVVAGWTDGGCREQMERLLGYRFTAISIDAPESAPPGGTLPLRIRLRNDGFAAPINPRPVEIRLSGLGRFSVTLAGQDARRWLPGREVLIETRLQLPNDIEEGGWFIQIALPDASPRLHDDGRYAIRLGNRGFFDASGDNDLADLRIDRNALGSRDHDAVGLTERP